MSQCHYCHAEFYTTGLYCCRSCELLSAWTSQGISPVQKIEQNESQKRHSHIGIEAQYNLSTCPVYKRFRLYVQGLQCSSCVHLLEELPHYCRQIRTAKIDFSRAQLLIEVSRDFSLGEVCAVVEQMGYQVTPLKNEDEYERQRKIERREEIKRIGVAAAIAGNQMLFSVPIYAGLSGTLATVFKWVSFTLFLPVLFYIAKPFYSRSWAALKVRRISVDLMIVIALWSGFVFSTYNLLTGGDQIYFDSTASFILLILTARLVLHRYQEKFLRKDILKELFTGELYDAEVDGGIRPLAVEQIEKGRVLLIRHGQLVPCDSILIDAAHDFDMSFVSGEAYPQKIHAGEKVRSGARSSGQSARIQASCSFTESLLAQSLKSADFFNGSKNFKTLTDITAERLTAIVFSIAAFYFIFTYHQDGVEAFKRSLALITIACPCAIAFGTPLAQSIGIKKALQQGYFIRSENVFERLNDIKKVVFDKTGTLTSNSLSLVQTYPENLSEEDKQIILGLERNSNHPVAIGLKKAWPHVASLPMKNILEEPGNGVQGEAHAHVYRLNKAGVDQNHQMQVDFTCDNRRLAYLFFEESLRPEAPSVIERLRQHDLDVMILSGDSRRRALEVGRQLKIRPKHVFSEQTPEAKEVVIQNENPCLFVGDGLNDIRGLNASAVSFAVRGPFEATYQVCDIFAPNKNLMSIVEIFDLSKDVYKVIQHNLLFAVFYNAAGGVLALTGFINPLMAAVLMPISSLIVISHTVWRLK